MRVGPGVRGALGATLAACALCASGCSKGGGGGPGDEGGYDYAGSAGAALYADQCMVCHGEEGEGGIGPALVDDPRGQDELASLIDRTMPKNDPGHCTGDCAAEVARFLKEGLTSGALACRGAVDPSPRRLRLLTRREYRNTVRDLFGAAGPARACQKATDCGYRESCSQAECLPSPCDAHTFVFDPHGRSLTSVYVAGSFNGWPASLDAAPGWTLSRDPSSSLWTGTFPLPSGTHAYKFVLDQTDWVADERAPASEPDGYGGQNSVLSLSCTGGGADDPAAGIPAETRPATFPFDDDADDNVVTALKADAYVSAAEAVASRAADHLGALLACDPSSDVPGCTRSLVATLGRRVFRRPLTADEATRYTALITSAPSFEGGARLAIAALLSSPHFLYRSEVGVPDGHGHYRLTAYEVATALSYGLLGTTPDDALLDAAARGELDDDAGLERWVRRLLDDPRARSQVGDLVSQWLGADAVLTVDKSAALAGDFGPEVRASLLAETRQFAAHVVFDGGGTLSELLTADYTVLDPRAAAFYGLPDPGGAAVVVQYPDGQRAGVLGHASVLAAYAHSDQTSPIRRGLLVRRRLLCQELPPPPPNGGGVPDVDPGATTRERFAQHTADPVCAGCHRYIDPPGFAFEHFDPIGRWRDSDAGHPVDASGDMTDIDRLGGGGSVPFEGEPDLAAALARSSAASACFARQAYRFERGFHETLAERCARRDLAARFDRSSGDVRQLLVDLFLSPDFRERR